MTISKKRKLLITQLDEHLALLQKSVIALDYSYDKCRTIRLFPLNGLPPTINYDTLLYVNKLPIGPQRY